MYRTLVVHRVCFPYCCFPPQLTWRLLEQFLPIIISGKVFPRISPTLLLSGKVHSLSLLSKFAHPPAFLRPFPLAFSLDDPKHFTFQRQSSFYSLHPSPPHFVPIVRTSHLHYVLLTAFPQLRFLPPFNSASIFTRLPFPFFYASLDFPFFLYLLSFFH